MRLAGTEYVLYACLEGDPSRPISIIDWRAAREFEGKRCPPAGPGTPGSAPGSKHGTFISQGWIYHPSQDPFKNRQIEGRFSWHPVTNEGGSFRIIHPDETQIDLWTKFPIPRKENGITVYDPLPRSGQLAPVGSFKPAPGIGKTMLGRIQNTLVYLTRYNLVRTSAYKLRTRFKEGMWFTNEFQIKATPSEGAALDSDIPWHLNVEYDPDYVGFQAIEDSMGQTSQ